MVHGRHAESSSAEPQPPPKLARTLPAFMRPTRETLRRELEKEKEMFPEESRLAHLLSLASRKASACGDCFLTGIVAGPCYTCTYARCSVADCPAGCPQSFEKREGEQEPSPCVHRFPHSFRDFFSETDRVTMSRSPGGWDSMVVSSKAPLSLRIQVADPETTPGYKDKLQRCLEQKFVPSLDDEDESCDDEDAEGREPVERFLEPSWALLEFTFECSQQPVAE